MIDAVDSGGYGVLGLYAAKAPVVPDPPSAPATTASPDTATTTGAAAISVPAAHAVGNGPVAAADPGTGDGNPSGREFFGEGQTLARQAAVTVSLLGSSSEGSRTGQSGATGSAGTTGTSPSSMGRALRAYSRSGETAGATGTGAMVAARA
jgi:hypothetical protein